MDPKAPIGVLDTGVGGYTVLRVLQERLPREDVIFYGDGWNVPYGNRSQEEILHLVRQCLDFLAGRGVKLVAVACNTISSLIDHYQQDYPFPILSIVQAGSDHVLKLGPREVGVYSTVFTARSGCYQRLIAAADPDIRVYAQGSGRLAALIEEGTAEGEELDRELDLSLGRLAEEHPELDTLVLGCTHFPIEQTRIQRRFPQFTRLIDPAWMQVRQVEARLAAAGGLNSQEAGSLRICTSGPCEKYAQLARRLGLELDGPVERVPPPVPLKG